MSRKTLFVLAIATLGFSSAVLSGEIYKWTDADGNVHFEDRPLGDNVERLDVASRSTNNSSVNASIVARREQEDARAEARTKRGEDAQAAADAKAEADKRATQCTAARKRMETYLQARRLYNVDDAGERVYLDETAIMKARDAAQEQIHKYCG